MSGISSFCPERAVCHHKDNVRGQGRRVIKSHAGSSATWEGLCRKSISVPVTPLPFKESSVRRMEINLILQSRRGQMEPVYPTWQTKRVPFHHPSQCFHCCSQYSTLLQSLGAKALYNIHRSSKPAFLSQQARAKHYSFLLRVETNAQSSQQAYNQGQANRC